MFAELEDSAGAASAACVLESEPFRPSDERLPEKRVSVRRPPRPLPWPDLPPLPRVPGGLAILGNILACQSQ